MSAPRRKNLIVSRRRADDEGEDEEGPLAIASDELSLSEGSVLSDADDDADGEGSDTSDVDTSKSSPTKIRLSSETLSSKANGKVDGKVPDERDTSANMVMADTEAMLNGLKISGTSKAVEEIQFEEMGQHIGSTAQSEATTSNGQALDPPESLIERRRREHEEYKQKRDADPAFVPNRGGFFMHDHRTANSGQNGFRIAGRGRGRGRGGYGTSSPSNVQGQISTPADAPWAHDLHETVAQPESPKAGVGYGNNGSAASSQARAGYTNPRTPLPNRSFSRTVLVGNVQVRVFLPGMLEPVVFPAMPFNQHTRLPHHRPPLRRDKPVRISIPHSPPRHIFPATERSFIFIPRALRPNQQGFGRGRGRGRGRGNYVGYNSYASGRTSAYGGSAYSPSLTMSRRSSLAREYSRDGMASPAGSSMSRNLSRLPDVGKPVVRLPPAGDHGPILLQSPTYSNGTAPMMHLPQHYPLPQKPLSSEHRDAALPMHQPRPQKAVSIADIESPAGMNFQPAIQTQQQPFHQQVPPLMYSQDAGPYAHSLHSAHPSQRGTPLSQIPERAIHAPPFQPFPYQPTPSYYPQPYPVPPMYYYPHQQVALAPSAAAPVFVPGQQYPFLLPTPAAPIAPAESINTVAHESNGMVYYYDSSQLTTSSDTPVAYPSVVYPPPNGYMVPQPAVYYSTP